MRRLTMAHLVYALLADLIVKALIFAVLWAWG